MEEQAICGDVEPEDCVGKVRRELRGIYEKSEIKKKYAEMAATFGRHSFDMGYCLDNKDCKQKNGWKRITGFSVAKVVAIGEAYNDYIMSTWSTGQLGWETKGFVEVARKAKADKMAKLVVALKTDLMKDAKHAKILKTAAWASKKQKAMKITNAAVKQCSSVASKFTGKLAGTLMKSAFVTSVKATGKAALALVKAVASKALFALGAFQLIFDIYTLINYFEDGEIALGVFTVISAIGGVISVVAGVCSMAFGVSTSMFAWSGPLAPLIGAIIGALAAIGALIYTLLNPEPGNQDYGDQFCCYTVALGMNPKVLGGEDNPTSRFAGKSESDCHEYGKLLQLIPSNDQGANASQRIAFMEEIPDTPDMLS